MKPITFTLAEWDDVLTRIKKDHPPSVWMIREKMKRKLGFTTREHKEWIGYYDDKTTAKRHANFHGYRTLIYLDFYDERYRSLFLLRYGINDALPERFDI